MTHFLAVAKLEFTLPFSVCDLSVFSVADSPSPESLHGLAVPSNECPLPALLFHASDHHVLPAGDACGSTASSK